MNQEQLTSTDISISRSVLDNMLSKHMEHHMDFVVHMLEQISKVARIEPTNVHRETEKNINTTIKTLNRMKHLAETHLYSETPDIDYVLNELNYIVEHKEFEPEST